MSSSQNKNTDQSVILDTDYKLAPVGPKLTGQQVVNSFELTDTLTEFMIKSNFFVTIEESIQPFNIDDKNELVSLINPLSSTDIQILTTAFLMAHEMNERKINYDAETVLNIDLDRFCKLWKIDNSEKKSGSVYHNLKNSIKRLQNRIFTYIDLQTNNHVRSSYFAYIEYGDSNIRFGFPRPFIQYLKNIDKFTWYYLENIIKLTGDTKQHTLSSYAVTLYENLQKEKNFAPIDENGNRIIYYSINHLRKMLALDEKSYSRNIDFKNKVLLKVLKMIETHTQLSVQIESIIEKKKLVKFKFICKFPQRDLDFKYAVSKKKNENPIMSHAQRKKYALLLSKNSSFSQLYRLTNESDLEFSTRIQKQLFRNENVIKFFPFLKVEGYDSNKVLAIIEANKKNSPAEIKDVRPIADTDDQQLPF